MTARVMPLKIAGTLLGLAAGAAVVAAPADWLPTPQAEPCVPFVENPEQDVGFSFPDGLSYEQVTTALNGVLQTALHCEKPAELSAVHLTYELVVGCNGVISTIAATETGGAPDAYVTCVSDVITKADFPAHDMADGMTVTYPVNVSW